MKKTGAAGCIADRPKHHFNILTRLRQHHAFDDMNHTIGGRNVCLHGSGFAHCDLAIVHNEIDPLTLNGNAARYFDNISGHHFARYTTIKPAANKLVNRFISKPISPELNDLNDHNVHSAVHTAVAQ